jgi:hypothetical protein
MDLMEKNHWLIAVISFIVVGTLLIVYTVIPMDNIIQPGTYNSTDPLDLSEISQVTSANHFIADLDPGELDQSQELREGMVYIGYPVPGFCLSQEVVNDRDNLLGFSVLIRTLGYTPPTALYFGIMKELDDPLQAESWDILYYLENVMINSWTWMSLEFSVPMDIAEGESFHIVLFSADDPLDGNCWYWGCSAEEEYNGNVHYWNFDSGSWVISSGLDMCFRTYTEEEDDPDPPPPPNVWLGKGITCGFAGPNCGDEGPERTNFEIGVDVYAYSLFSASGGYDFHGKTMKHKWYYNGEQVWEWTKTCSYHYTSYWCGWTWWDIGSDLGPGQGVVKFYINDAYIGSTELFNVIDPDPPQPPVVSITFNSWVLQGFGLLSYLGAVIAGIKYVRI